MKFTIVAGLLLAVLAAPVDAAPPDDSYIAGYATAVLQQEYRLSDGSIEVRRGVVTVIAENLRGAQRDRVISALKRIPGVVEVEVVSPEATPSTGDPAAVRTEILPPASLFLPRGQLFDPLHADPRWPHFSAAYRRYINEGREFTNVFAPTFGETLALYRNKAPFGGQWELGFQGGVFAIFDIDTRSKDLINADYLAALLGSYRSGDFSAFIRVAHISSHLGDEYLLRSSVNQINRVNLSLESVDVKLSYDFRDVVRIYGGGGALVRTEPTGIKAGTVQYGIEFQSPQTYFGGAVRPVAYGDFQSFEENNWSTDVSVRTGVQFENARIGDRYVQLLLEYFNGYSPNGQFFVQRIESIGLGIHLYF